jgi:hypothetical protein
MITHFGLFWSERDVYWGQPGKDLGQLLGREKAPLGRKGAPTKAERNNAANYRTYIGLYCLYGEGELHYIGQAGLGTNATLFDRLKRHRKGPMAGRWDAFSWFGRENCDGKTDVQSALKQLEAIAISIINPGNNKQSGAFSGATQVYQVPHEAAAGNLETQLAKMASMIEGLKEKRRPA